MCHCRIKHYEKREGERERENVPFTQFWASKSTLRLRSRGREKRREREREIVRTTEREREMMITDNILYEE